MSGADRRALDPRWVIACACLVVTIAMGIRHGFGLFMRPVGMDLGISREAFGFAVAVQNIIWGLSQPITGMLADRFGTGRVVLAGSLLYALGLLCMSGIASPLGLTASLGVMIGFGCSGTTFAIVFGAVGRASAPEKRVQALALVSAAGSFGQFAMLPVTQRLIGGFGWAEALLWLAAIALFIAPLAAGLAERGTSPAKAGREQSVAAALHEAWRHGGFKLLTLGYFVCGFQVVFIGLHLPAFLGDKGFKPEVAVTALALIGLFNIFGSYGWGRLGAHFAKKNLLALLYLLRSAGIGMFLLLPLSPFSVYAFAISMGLLWLGTVPLTSGIIAQVFGVRYLSMLTGVAFLSHQLGSFAGAWLGGYLFDRTGSYDLVWQIALALGVLAAIANWPIDERPLATTQARPA